jgi:uncharacterized protein (DUF1330 family)
MAAYVIADATIHDMEKHRAAFLPAVDKLIAEMGAKISARQGFARLYKTAGSDDSSE